MNMTMAGFTLGDTSALSMAQLAETTNQTFSGYFLPIAHTPQTFASFARLHSLDLAQSVTLTHADGQVVGLTMLGIRDDRGWCGGFGVIPEFRGQGLAKWLILGLIERARNNGLRLLQLEVLSQNEPAIRAYRGAGLETVWDVCSFMGGVEEILPHLSETNLRPEPVSPLEGIRLLPPTAAIPAWTAPAWQREPVMLFLKSDVLGLSITSNRGSGVLLYGYSAVGGVLRIEQFAFDSVTIAHALLGAAIRHCQNTQQKVGEDKPLKVFLLNEPENTPLFALLNGFGLPIIHRQHEMQIPLRS
jgi:ribosomal protein S18 acetylase RimI-like enzyme